VKIGLLTVATGAYVQFLDGLVASARRHFFRGHDVTVFVFSDAPATPAGTVLLPAAHEPWPEATLRRYHLYARHDGFLGSMDYLFCVDVDMKFVAPCGEEILPGETDRLVGVEHPGFWRADVTWAARLGATLSFGRRRAGRLPHGDLPFERNPDSLACVGDPAHRLYFAGGFNGGFADSFLTMARSLRDAIDHDRARGILAVWHDESHLNRYFYVQPPKRLLPSYCFPESGYPHLRHLAPVLVALDKDHASLRRPTA
jgi:hypothetical protein